MFPPTVHRVPISPHLCQHLLFSVVIVVVVLIVAILMGMRQYHSDVDFRVLISYLCVFLEEVSI